VALTLLLLAHFNRSGSIHHRHDQHHERLQDSHGTGRRAWSKHLLV